MSEIVSAESLQKISRKIVELKTGRCYEIRRISPAELSLSFGGITDLIAAMSADEKTTMKKMQGNPDAMTKTFKSIDCILVTAVVSPKLSMNGNDGLSIEDVPWEDRMELFPAILSHSGFSKEDGQALSNFRKK